MKQLYKERPNDFFKFTAMSIFPSPKRKGSPPEGIYPKSLKATEVRHYITHMNSESNRLLVQLLRQKTNIDAVRQTPLKIIGAEDDGLILKKDLIETAEIYHTPCSLYPDSGHMIMFGPHKEAVADEIIDWILSL